MQINVPNRKEMVLDALPDAVYIAEIFSIKAEKSSKGNDMFVITNKIQSEAPDGSKAIGRNVTDWVTVTPDSLWRVNQLFEAAVGSSLPEGETTIEELMQVVIEACTGQTVSITVTSRTHNGRRVNDVKGYDAIAA